ncbi:MAG TPA: maleylpyruvate isomerase N-terminal domain-containing protein [Anaerolineales bacterium]|nr:maleylpyruvate isomerase N-terminal domain-containing protein [Anaerolineales bacterium]
MTHTRKEVIRRAVREFRLLDQLVAGLTAAEWRKAVPRTGTKDPWTVKDALAHITYWKAGVVREARGKRMLPEHSLKPTQLNHLVYTRYRKHPPREVLEWHRRVHEDLLKALQEAPDAWFSRPSRRDNWPYDLDGHSAEHRLKDIRQALARRKTKAR